MAQLKLSYALLEKTIILFKKNERINSLKQIRFIYFKKRI